MKAITLKELGGPENLIASEVPLPALKADAVLVKVHAISVNPVDTLVRSNERFLKGVYGETSHGEPVILGWDLAGTVVETGSLVTRFKVGDEVFGMVNFPGQGKAYAEFSAVPETQLAIKPEQASFNEAAAATLAALTAWQSLVTYAKIKSSEKVIIHSAAGGVGHMAVQMAKSFGAYVIGTGSADSLDFIRSLGADEVIDYQKTRFEDVIQDADVVIDGVSYGTENILRSIKSLKKGGRLISLLAGFDDEVKNALLEKDIFGHKFFVVSSGMDMDKIAGLLAKGKLKPYLSAVLPFHKLSEAHIKLETGKTRGKIVLTVPD